MRDLIEAFLAERRRWAWGGVDGEDCSTLMASWWLYRTGVDPAADLRGTYSTEAEANAIVARHGGMAGLGSAIIEPHGARRTIVRADGDIGIVSGRMADEVVREIPGICFGPLWVVMTPFGAMAKHMDWTGIAWRIP